MELPTTLSPILLACGGLHSAAVTEHGHLYTWGHAAKGQTGQRSGRPLLTPKLLPSASWEGRAEKERRVPIEVSAADERTPEGGPGRRFVVRGKRFAPLQAESAPPSPRATRPPRHALLAPPSSARPPRHALAWRRSPQVSSLSCGMYHSAICTVEGALYSWGANSDGQLGLGDTTDRHFPHLVASDFGGGMVLQVACGGKHSLALGQDGRTWGWGCNSHKQVGVDSSGRCIERPRVINDLSSTRMVQLSAGGAHSAALSADGACFTWGKNQNGQLGHGTASLCELPNVVEALPLQTAWVACGGAHTACMLRLQDGTGLAPLSNRTSMASARSSNGSEGGTFRRDDSFMDRYQFR